MSHGKPFTIYAHATGPNPWKVQMIFEELGIEYEPHWADMSKNEHKSAEYTKLNPNGRLPTIIDHSNNDFVLWESGAIILYLIDKYDKDNKISYPANSAEDWQTKQWLFFQVSGQGPYFGQSAWFKFFHPEKIQSAIERYEGQTSRVLEVIDLHLKQTNQKWLVGDKCTYADISFVTWCSNLDFFTGNGEWKTKYPLMADWLERVNARPAVKKIVEWKASLMPQHNAKKD